jgi:uncharacterized protein (TIGR02186 family)
MKPGHLLAVVILGLAAPASAEDLVSGLSQDVVEITSNYTGTDIVVFGAIERPGDMQGRDIVVVVRGPDIDMTVRRKDRIGGIWLNNDRAVLDAMPSYYFVASTRPMSQIASSDTLKRYDLGLANLEPQSVSSHHDSEPFREAAIRQEMRGGLYAEAPSGVEFLSETLFRVRVPVPATVPRGQYNAAVYLFRDGTVISAQSTPLFIDQTGFERRILRIAHESPFTYGVSTVLAAALLGWLSSLMFRRND